MSNSNQRSLQQVSLVAVLLLLPSFTPARADNKLVGPVACRPAGTETAGLQYRVGGVTNVSGAAMDVVCTLIRDTVSNTNGLRDLEVAVTDPAGSLLCDAVSENRAGDPLKIVRRSISGTGSKILDWGSSLNLSVNRGHYSLNCFLPNNATIHSIYYDENSN